MMLAAKLSLSVLLPLVAVSAGGTSAQPSKAFLLEIRPAGSHSADRVAATTRVIRKRLAAAQINASVMPTSSGRLEVLLKTAPPRFLEKLLTAPGRVVLRITPHGDVYRPASGRPMRAARATYDELGEPGVEFQTSDPHSFLRFTQNHLGKRCGIYLDGRLISDPVIDGPISRTGLIVGHFSREETQVIAAVIGSGPLPAVVRMLPMPGRGDI